MNELQILFTLGFFLLLMIIFYSPNWLKTIILSVICAAATTATVIVVMVPTMSPQRTTEYATQYTSAPTLQANVNLGSNAKWKWVYAFQKRWEGNKCTVDPVLTYAGTTQAAYNAYRRSKGLPLRHVCKYLTQAEHEEIAYQRYYIASGAYKLPAHIALQVHDFAYNAGALRVYNR